MEGIPTGVCGSPVALGDVEVLGVDDALGEPLGVHIRGRSDVDCPQLACTYATDLADADCPPELRRLDRTLTRRHTPIVNWRHAG